MTLPPAISGSRTFQGAGGGGGLSGIAGRAYFVDNGGLSISSPYVPVLTDFDSLYSDPSFTLVDGALVIPRSGWYVVEAHLWMDLPASEEVALCTIETPSEYAEGPNRGSAYLPANPGGEEGAAGFRLTTTVLMVASAGESLIVTYYTASPTVYRCYVGAAWVAPIPS